MLTHIFNTAKGILSRSPSAQGRSSEAKESPPVNYGPSHGIEVTMVTTRRGTETPGQETTPRSSAKRKAGKRELDNLDTPTAAKRQRKSPPKSKEAPQPAAAVEDAIQDSTEDTSDTIAVTVTETETASTEGKLPIRRRSSPKVIVGKLSLPVSTELEDGEEAIKDDAPVSTQESVYETPETDSGSVYATPATRKKVEASPTPRDRRHNERSSGKKSSGRKDKTVVESEEAEKTPTQSNFRIETPTSSHSREQAPITSQDTPLAPSQPEKAHVRFGSEEPADTQQSTIEKSQGHKRYEAPQTAQDDDDDASDSDEAPEVVSTTTAVSKAKASEQEATRALEAQQHKELGKRLAREARIREQQGAKREREEHKAKKLAKKLAKQQAVETPTGDDGLPTTINRKNLPALLPTSLLSNLPDQRAPTPPPERRGKTEEQMRKEKLNHHIKFLERASKGPKELKKGKLSVAVLGQQNRVLPPKVNRDTKNLREKWLKGRQDKTRKVKGGKGIGGKAERRPFGNKGFLRGED